MERPPQSSKWVESAFEQQRAVESILEDVGLPHSADMVATRMTQGVDSYVYKVERVSDSPFIVKFSRNTNWRPEGERDSLDAWRNVGVSVPDVLAVGHVGNLSYLQESYVDAPTLEEAYPDTTSMLQDGVYRRIGALLQQMHRAPANGYGTLVDEGQGAHKTFNQWVSARLAQPTDTNGHEAFTGTEAILNEAIASLVEFNNSTRSVYCHDDLTPDNIFATTPYTPFDPHPVTGDPMIDLARTILRPISKTDALGFDDDLLEGYGTSGNEIDMQHLRAAMIVAANLFLFRFTRNEMSSRAERIQKYMAYRWL